MKIINIFILSFLFSLSFSTKVSSQSKEIDSLKNELKIHKEKDTTRVNILYDLAFTNFQTDMNLTKVYLKEAEDLSNNLNYTRGKAKVNYLKGMLENMKSNYAASLTYFERSLKHYESIQDRSRIASVYIAFGINYYDLAKYDDALKYYEKATEIYQELGNKRELITSLINSGNVYSELGRYDEAISNYKKALTQSKATNDEESISFVHANLGVVYKLQGNYPLAIENYNKRLDYNRKTSDTLGMALMLNNFGEVYTSMGKYDKALEYHKHSLNFALQKENKSSVAVNNSNIGNIYMHKKDYFKALNYYRLSLDASEEINNVKQTSICYNNIGTVNLLLNKPLVARKNFLKAEAISEGIGHKEALSASLLGIAESYLFEKNYKEALINALKANEISDEINHMLQRKNAQELLSEIYKYTGFYKKSLESYEQFKILNDSLFNKENIEKIAQIEYEYRYKQALDSANIRELKLTKTITATSKDLEKSKQNYLWAVIGFLLVSIVLGSIIFFQKFRNIKSKNENIMMQQKLLRSQMTPHFIFNSMSVLQGMILNKEGKKSISYLSKLSKLLRIILENSRDKTVLLCQEIEAVEDYLALHNLENETYKYEIIIEDIIDKSAFQIPPMLIQPFVENAIEHAFKNQNENKIIAIHLTYTDKKLIATITDNGIGVNAIKENKKHHKKSLATTITSERLKILAKDFKMEGSIQIEDRQKYNEQGTIVTIVIPHIKLQK
jgi:tetratricopeptide (TPR) repeat protein